MSPETGSSATIVFPPGPTALGIDKYRSAWVASQATSFARHGVAAEPAPELLELLELDAPELEELPELDPLELELLELELLELEEPLDVEEGPEELLDVLEPLELLEVEELAGGFWGVDPPPQPDTTATATVNGTTEYGNRNSRRLELDTEVLAIKMVVGIRATHRHARLELRCFLRSIQYLERHSDCSGRKTSVDGIVTCRTHWRVVAYVCLTSLTFLSRA
jgi:hypothetical protein